MKKDDVKAVLGRVLSWPPDDQEKVARFVREMEQRRADDDIGEEEWVSGDYHATPEELKEWQPRMKSRSRSLHSALHEG
jgi:hypothetical protein